MAKVLVSMSDDFLAKIDNTASIEQRSRSELIREALRVYIRRSAITDTQRAENNAKILEKILD